MSLDGSKSKSTHVSSFKAINLLYSEYLRQMDVPVRTRQRLKGKEFLEARYRRAIAMIHKVGIQAKLGNTLRSLEPAEVCNLLKVICIGRRLTYEQFKFMHSNPKYMGFDRKNPIILTWKVWAALRTTAKRIQELEQLEKDNIE